jgi:molecular chaperone IbpA|tara:strand:- start:7197 stop:7643 length:447 start_codon:yes stop_codon:yes gene_type:complete
MTSIDLLSRFGTFSVGFDQLFQELERAKYVGNSNYPPYNIIKVDDENYIIELAVAGFKENEIELTLTENKLTVSAAVADKPTSEYLHKGLSSREFYKDFILNTDVLVKRADINDGVLQIQLTHIIPEELKPRTIEIGKDVSVKTFLSE